MSPIIANHYIILKKKDCKKTGCLHQWLPDDTKNKVNRSKQWNEDGKIRENKIHVLSCFLAFNHSISGCQLTEKNIKKLDGTKKQDEKGKNRENKIHGVASCFLAFDR